MKNLVKTGKAFIRIYEGINDTSLAIGTILGKKVLDPGYTVGKDILIGLSNKQELREQVSKDYQEIVSKNVITNPRIIVGYSGSGEA